MWDNSLHGNAPDRPCKVRAIGSGSRVPAATRGSTGRGGAIVAESRVVLSSPFALSRVLGGLAAKEEPRQTASPACTWSWNRLSGSCRPQGVFRAGGSFLSVLIARLTREARLPPAHGSCDQDEPGRRCLFQVGEMAPGSGSCVPVPHWSGGSSSES